MKHLFGFQLTTTTVDLLFIIIIYFCFFSFASDPARRPPLLVDSACQNLNSRVNSFHGLINQFHGGAEIIIVHDFSYF